ncbi:MAG: PhnD/SsuA/transferrin family substrate-binding protein [Deltaproteobacteria bacterium]|nr:PhnD/SsuA/transferrin family substrate-binding protein [Deltaproteobacteria bacterium]
MIAAALLVVTSATLTASTASAADSLIYFYDPDANHQAIVDITNAFDGFLTKIGLGAKFQPLAARSAFEASVAKPDTQFVIVSSDYVKNGKGVSLVPVLVPSANGDTFYHKLLVDRGMGAPGELDGLAIAATLTGEDQSGQSVLSRLQDGGVKVKGAAIVPVSKDIDALLALSFGQVQAALVTPNSLALLKRIKPQLVASIRQVYQMPKILRSPLCVVADRASPERKREIVEAFKRMSKEEEGQQAMRTMGFDQWVVFEPGMLKK